MNIHVVQHLCDSHNHNHGIIHIYIYISFQFVQLQTYTCSILYAFNHILYIIYKYSSLFDELNLTKIVSNLIGYKWNLNLNYEPTFLVNSDFHIHNDGFECFTYLYIYIFIGYGI